jgi:hypothetical protein
MFCTRLPTRPKCSPGIGPWLACVGFVLLAGTCALALGRGGLSATTGLDTLIQVLFGDLPADDSVDANGDGAVTVADVVVLAVPAVPTPTPTPVGLLFAGVISDLLPHAVGDQLVYRVTDPLGAVTTETTTAISSDPGGTFVIDDEEVDSHQQVLKHERQSYADTSTQLLFQGFTDQMTGVTTDCHRPLLRMVMPLIAGQSFSTSDPTCTSMPNCVTCDLVYKGQDFGYVDRSDTFTPVDIVSAITVTAGTFTNVIHISGSTQVQGTALETDEVYFAVGVGPILDVATTNGQITRSELVSGTIGGVPVAP